MTFEDRRLTLNDGVFLDFAVPIEEAIAFDDAVVVLTIDPKKNTENRNLYAYSHDGRLLWRAADRSFRGAEVNPYLGIERVDGRHVRAWDNFGAVYTIAAQTGDVVERRWGK